MYIIFCGVELELALHFSTKIKLSENLKYLFIIIKYVYLRQWIITVYYITFCYIVILI